MIASCDEEILSSESHTFGNGCLLNAVYYANR